MSRPGIGSRLNVNSPQRSATFRRTPSPAAKHPMQDCGIIKLRLSLQYGINERYLRASDHAMCAAHRGDSCAWANLRIAPRSGNPACRFLAETGGGRRRTVAPGCCPLARHVAEHHLDTMKILVV